MKIAVNTGGGDAAGLNAVLCAVVRGAAELGCGILPVRECAHRHTAPDGGTGARTTEQAPACRGAGLGKQAIDRRRTGAEDTRAHALLEPKMAMPFERVDERRQQRAKALGADTVRRLPQDQQCLPDRVALYARPRWASGGTIRTRDVQGANGVLGVPPRHRDELVEDPPLLFPTACSLSIAYHSPARAAARCH